MTGSTDRAPSSPPDLSADEPRETDPEIVSLPSALLSLTFDQLRTFVSLRSTLSAARTATELGRDQSSVQKQLVTLNKHFQALCGEPVARAVPRQNLSFSSTGDLFAQSSKELLRDWFSALDEQRRKVGTSLSVGATSFILDFVPATWNRVVRTLEESHIELVIKQIRTHEVLDALRKNEVDVTLGGILLEKTNEAFKDPDIDFIGWEREGVVMLTNDLETDFPSAGISPETLKGMKLLAPRSGIVHEFLRQWYGDDYPNELNLLPVTGDILFYLSLLRSNSILGCMLVPQYLVQPQSQHVGGLRLVRLNAPDYPDLEVVAGLFVRKRDRESLSADHPLHKIWDLFLRVHENEKTASVT